MDPLAIINGLKMEISETPEAVTIIKKVDKTPKVKTPKVEPKKKSRFNALIDEDILERARNIVVEYEDESISDLAEKGLRWAVEQFEASIGGPAPKRTTELKVGRKKKKVVDVPSTTKQEKSQPKVATVETEVIVSPTPEPSPVMETSEIEVNV